MWFGDILLQLAPTAAFTNMCICIEMYEEAPTSSAIGQQVTALEFPSIPGSNTQVYAPIAFILTEVCFWYK